MLTFLREKVFEPVINSEGGLDSTKERVRTTAKTLEGKGSAKEIIEFYWTAIMNSTDLPKRMKEGGFVRFEEVMEEFRERFNEGWLWRD